MVARFSIVLLLGILDVIGAVQPWCDYSQNMAYDQTYYIYNAEYPNNYGPSVFCRWIAVSPPDTRISLTCNDISMPSTNGCSGDRLAVSLTGNGDLTDAHNYCGTGTLNLVSSQNKIAIGLLSAYNSPGGRFACSIVAIRSPPPTCQCGARQNRRIVGGTEVGVNEYPSMAALIDVTQNQLYCGATIIASRYALTAAHCTTNKDAYKVGLLVGDHDISTGSDTNAAALYALDKFIVHESYESVTFRNDIAIARTQNTINFSINVGPACLPFKYTSGDFTGQSVTILGWGTIDFTGPKSNKLLGANLSIVSNYDCQARNPQSTIYDTNICTYTKDKDSCQSDSGGPCLWQDNNSGALQLIGIISFGMGCATSRPGVSTRVTSYLNWIVSKTSEVQYCVK